MHRFFTPTLLLLGAGTVAWYNQQPGDQRLLFPFVSWIFPATQGDPDAQGAASVQLLAGLGALTTCLALVGWWRDIRRGDP